MSKILKGFPVIPFEKAWRIRVKAQEKKLIPDPLKSFKKPKIKYSKNTALVMPGQEVSYGTRAPHYGERRVKFTQR